MADDRELWQAKHDAAAKIAGGQSDHLEAAAKVSDAAAEAAGEGSEPEDGELETTSVEAEEKPTKPAAKSQKK